MLKAVLLLLLISSPLRAAEPVTYTYWVAVDSFTQTDLNGFAEDGIRKSGRNFQETRLLLSGNTHYMVLEITPVPIALKNKYNGYLNQGSIWLAQTSYMQDGVMIRSGIAYPPDFFPFQVVVTTP